MLQHLLLISFLIMILNRKNIIDKYILKTH